MSNVKFAEDGARDALNALRSDGDSTDFIVLGYNDKKQVVLQASGDGGVAAMNAVLDPKQIQYGMVRVRDIVDGHETVKFVWIVWQGSEVKMIAKARVTTHRGEVKDFFGQAHVTLDCNTHEECSEANVLSLVSDASGSSTRVLEGSVAGERQQQNRTVTAAGKKSGAPFEFQKEAEMDEALQMVRNGTGQEWVLVGYRDSDSNTVQLLGQGSGGADELASLLAETSAAYGLVRVGTEIDGHAVSRFVVIVFVGEAVGGLRRGQLVTQQGRVLDKLGQRHVELAAHEKTEVSAARLQAAVDQAAGVALNERTVEDHVEDTSVTNTNTNTNSNSNSNVSSKSPRYASASLVAQPKKGSAVNTASVSLSFGDGIREAVDAVRSDGNSQDWMLLGYESGDKALSLVAQGGGGANALSQAIPDEDMGCYYGYLRIDTSVDGLARTIFVFVMFQGDKIKVIRKSRLATHVGSIVDFIGQFHLKLEFARKADISAESVGEAVNRTTGEASGKVSNQ